MIKGKFEQSIIYDAEGNKINGAVEKTEITQMIENSYFFGQFMAYHMVAKLVQKVGGENALKFAEKKFMEIGKGNPAFLIKAEELEKTLMRYYHDSMAENETHIKG